MLRHPSVVIACQWPDIKTVVLLRIILGMTGQLVTNLVCSELKSSSFERVIVLTLTMHPNALNLTMLL